MKRNNIRETRIDDELPKEQFEEQEDPEDYDEDNEFVVMVGGGDCFKEIMNEIREMEEAYGDQSPGFREIVRELKEYYEDKANRDIQGGDNV